MTSRTSLLVIPSARMPLYSRLLRLVEDTWFHSLKPHGRNSIQLLYRSRRSQFHLSLLQRLSQSVLWLRLQLIPRPEFSRSQNLSTRYSTLIQAMVSRVSGFLTLSKTCSSTRLRYQRTTILQLSRTWLMLPCCSLSAMWMPQLPCPNLVAVVAVHHSLDGARRMTRTIGSMLAVASRCPILCADQCQSHVVVITDKTISL